jgi:hypothetical protein
MRKSALIVILLLAAGTVQTAPAKTKKKAQLSKLFCQARYVSVQTYEGDTTAEVGRAYPLDYNAAIGVQHRVQTWGRYVLVYPPQPADLVFVVWKEPQDGNRLPGQPTGIPPVSTPRMPDPGTRYPGQTPGQPGQQPGQGPGGVDGPDGVGVSRGGPGIGGVWPVHDQLAVYLPWGDGEMSAPLWKKSEKDGLNEPDMKLFGKLADAVDDGCSDSGSGSN